MTHSYFLHIHWKQFHICELHDTTEQNLSAFSGWQNLPLPICWTYLEQSSIHPGPFPWPTQHQFPILSLQAASIPQVLLSTPLGPLNQGH